LRYEVPVDDKWHRIDHLEDVVHVDCRNVDVVEFWATDPVSVRRVDTGDAKLISATYTAERSSGQRWEYRVFGTGHPDVDGLYVGTALAAGGVLVWHLFRREVQP
jgi:hypothetical protein